MNKVLLFGGNRRYGCLVYLLIVSIVLIKADLPMTSLVILVILPHQKVSKLENLKECLRRFKTIHGRVFFQQCSMSYSMGLNYDS